MKKKLLSCCLLLAVLFACLPMNSVMAKTSKTKAQAFSYLNGLVGQTVGSGECVALISAYYKYLGFSPVSGNGCDYATNAIPSGSGWTREKGGVPRPGDILVYTGGYGHVAICESTNVAWHQNWNGRYVQKVTRNYSAGYTYGGQYVSYWGCIHVAFADETPTEQPVNLGDSFYAYIINTAAWKHLTYDNDWNITSRTETGKANQIWYFSKQSDNSYKITSVKDGRCMEVHNFGKEAGTNVHMNDYSGNSAQLWYVYGKSGAYKLRAKCTDCVLDLADNSSAEGANIQMWTSNDTPAQKFQIWKLSLPTIPKPTLKVAIDNNYINNAVFSWEPVDNAHYYDLRIMENGNIIKTIWATKDTHYNVNLPAGNYTANVAGINDNFRNYTFSGTISFSIPNSDRPTTDFNVIYENSQSIVRNNTDNQQSVVVIIANYMNGTIKDINIKNEIFAARETKTYSHGANARVFVWDSLMGMKPLAQ